MAHAGRRTNVRGFTLIELLVVIVIIGIIVGLAIPALSGARTTAKRASTNQMLSDLMQACSAFQLDKRVLPGYFSPAEMGNTENDARGMSAMQNIMLSLAGGLLAAPPTGVPASEWGRVGPLSSPASHVIVQWSLIGAAVGTNKPYYVPQARYFSTEPGRIGDPVHAQLPDLKDAFGNPVMAWVQNDSATTAVQTEADFAAINATGPNPSRFYWTSNSAFLKATALGKRLGDQNTQSILGESMPPASRVSSMVGLLGNPGAVKDPSKATRDVLPTEGRGRLVFHSAGADGIFLSKTDKGGKNSDAGVLRFGLNIKDMAGTFYTDSSGKARLLDVTNEFDDVIVTGGN